MLKDSVRSLSGIGEKRAELLESIGVYTVNDLLSYFPRDYEDRTKITYISNVLNEQTVCIRATVFSDVTVKMPRKGLSIYTAVLFDETGKINATWFNNKYIKNSIRKGETYVFYGKIKKDGPFKQILSPIFEPEDKNNKTRQIVPIYPLRNGLTQNVFYQAVKCASEFVKDIKDPLPDYIKQKLSLMNLSEAIYNIHFPSDFQSYDKARRRVVFDELFILSMALLSIKSGKDSKMGKALSDISCIGEFISSLPYKLTSAQDRVIKEIAADLKKSTPMSRLVQGDVGSGKTVVGAAAIYTAVKNGYQAVMMAPTEILAAQHYENFKKLFPKNFNICLLNGSMTASLKKSALEDIESGKARVIVGTHALIQEGVNYKNLNLVITDEQHRFGVNQREAIAKKGNNPHVLVMSATPIPRTLALILYGDMDISIIDALPPGRKKIETYAVDESMRERINNFIKKHVLSGRQIYIVCPLVEESESIDLTNVTEYTKKLKGIFPGFNISLLHGKMKASEKNQTMLAFKNGEIDILVSTTVVEVGVDVPNANVIVVENAERFGLAQLHQLRGRVGRGEHQSYAILFNQSDTEVSKKRMKIMASSSDGFYIAEQDLLLRGSGDFFGVRQHGLPSFKVANLFNDMDILKLAQASAKEVLSKDLTLSLPEHTELKKVLESKVRALFL